MTARPETAGGALRELTFDDLPEVLEIERALFPEDAWSERMFRDELVEVPATRYYAVVPGADRRVLGYAGLCVVADEGDVQTIAVREDHWGWGIGRRLLTALIDEARRRGVRDLYLEVRTDNHRARAMYERTGFVALGIRRGYYRGADALAMRLRLERSDARVAARG